MVDKCSSPTASLLETLDSERRRKWRQDVTKPVFCCLQMPGGRDTINCQMPTPRDSSCNKCPGFAQGGWMLAAGIDSHIILTFRAVNTIMQKGRGHLFG